MEFQSNNPAVMDLQTKVITLRVTNKDVDVYSANGGNGKFSIGENIKEVRSVVMVDDSAAALLVFAASTVAISGSTDIVVTGLALAASDVAELTYVLA